MSGSTPSVSANLKASNRKQFVWPAAGIVVGFFVARMLPIAGISLSVGLAACCAAMLLVLILSAHPIGARVGAVLAGMFLWIPCGVWESPLARCLLACLMAAPFLAATALVSVPPIAGFRARVAYLFTWCGTREVKPRTPSFDGAALRNLILATAVLGAAIAVVKAASAFELWVPVRWLAGGIMIFACAEMITHCLALMTAGVGLSVPPLFQSPYRSASVGEFWTQRWNIVTSQLFRRQCFAPLARHGAALALSAAFIASAAGHALLVYLGLGRWGIALVCGAFFLVQPLLIAAERRLKVRRWRPAAGRAWTLAVLAITSPLIVEPTLQILERSWDAAENVLLPPAIALAAVTILSGIVSLASLAIIQEPPRLVKRGG